MKKKLIAAALCLALCLTACGKEAETVTDYGGEDTRKTTAGSTSGENGSEENATSSDSTEGSSGSKVAALPAPQVDGEPIYEESFDLNGKPVEISIKTLERDADHFHSCQMKEVKTDSEYEKNLVQRVFGDTAKEVKRDLSLEEGDSELIMDTIKSGMFSISGDTSIWNKTTVPGWDDEAAYPYHTYEGIYRDIDYQLLITVAGDYGRRISLYPKHPGDVIGVPECDTLYVTQNYLSGENYEMLDRAVIMKAMSDRPNRTKAGEETMISAVEDFMKEILQVEVNRDDLKLTMGEQVGNPYKRELLFYPKEEESSKTLDGAVLEGYEVMYDMSHTGLEFSLTNAGAFGVTDKGVVGFTVDILYEVEQVLSEDVQLLAFDKIMDSFRQGMKENFDMQYVNGSRITVESTKLVYYPSDSLDKPGECTLVPVWRFVISSNGAIGQAYINAIDGSWVTALYNHWEP